MPQSVWDDSTTIKKFDSLPGDTKTDILIIGGGLCGILCAWFLHREGADYMLVEKGRIGEGNTQNTTAKITSQHGLIYSRLLHSLGRERAALYLDANQKAIEEYRKLAGNIDCDFEEKTAGVYSCDDPKAIAQELRALEALGFAAKYAERLPLPEEIKLKAAVLFPKQAQFHPLKFLAGAAENLNIHENTFVHGVDWHTAYTDKGKITAGKIIVATHFPFLNKRGSYFLKLYQNRSYAVALEHAGDVNGMYIDAAKGGLSFRNYGSLLLLGGGGGRTGTRHGGWRMLREFATSAYPGARELYSWAAQDCMSLDGMPYIGNYSLHTPDLYTASGFNKWGMTSSMAAALLLRDLVLGRENIYRELFSPSRSMLKPQLFLNGLEASKNLLTPTLKRCPHMGCALKWNPLEHTWDCPCHGSRFEGDGKLMENPAVRDASSLKDSS